MGFNLVVGVCVGGALLGLLPLLGPLEGPTRAPDLLSIVRTLAACAGVAALCAAIVWRERPATLGSAAALLGLGALALVMGIAPELLRLPTRGIGDRLWGVPTLLGLPVAGAALLAGSPRARVAGGAGCALALAGLLQPTWIVDQVRPALGHHLQHLDTTTARVTIGLGAAALAGLLAIPAAALRPTAPWVRAIGWALAGALPAWTLYRAAFESPIGPAATAYLLCTGATALLVVGMRSLADAPPAWARRALPIAGEAAAVLLLAALWWLLKSFTWRWSTTDENIYFYGATLLGDGVLPYRDFFFAHPPMHLGVPAALFLVFGFHLTLAKLIPVVSAFATGLLVWHLVRERVSRFAALLSFGCFLFALGLLQASTNMNGVNLTSLWLTAGLYCSLRGRPALAGVMLGLAVTTGFYAIAGALALCVLAPFGSLRSALRLVLSFIVVAGGINLLCWALAGDAFIESVYTYHTLKEARPLTPEFIRALYHHPHLFVGVLLAPLTLIWARVRGVPQLGETDAPSSERHLLSPFALSVEPAAGAVKVAWLVFAALLVEMTLFREVYSFYFALLFPTAAICTGYAVATLVAAVVHEVRALADRRLRPLSAVVVVGLALLWSLWVPLKAEANWIFAADRGKGTNYEWLSRGERREYRWIEPAAWPSVSGPVVRALFWRDHRIKGHMAPGYRHFLWQKSLHLSVIDDIAAFIRDNSAEDETIAGSSLVAPAVALASGRRIAAHEVDTNAKRFHTGLTDLPSFIDAICRDRIRFLVLSPSGSLNDRTASGTPSIRKWFRPVKRFADPWNKFLRPGRRTWGVTVWALRAHPVGDGPRCHWIGPR